MAAHTIHHVSAITAQIGTNLDFYTKTLGLRLVKRSVNQDDVKSYHLFYADAVGSPGTDMTFFDLPMAHPSAPGAGSVSLTSFRIPSEAVEWWETRLAGAGTLPETDQDELGRTVIQFIDPEGQRLELVADSGIAGGSSSPWTAEVPAERAIRGFIGVDITTARPEGTAHILSAILGYRHVLGSGAVFEAGDESSYACIRLFAPENPRPARIGAGGVHHVAFRVTDDDELAAVQAKVEALGIKTSGYVDRYYFHSVYFREPGGVLFELATDGPGFGSDEDFESLGARLALPPFLEDRRAEIEAGLKPLPALV